MEPLRYSLLFVFLSVGLCDRISYPRHVLKMDEALLTVHNQLLHGITVLYSSDYCYKCVYQHLASVETGLGNVSVVVSTPFTLLLRVQLQSGNVTLCGLSKTFGEGGHYSLWVNQALSQGSGSCSLVVDKPPHNIYLPLLVATLLLALLLLLWVSGPFILRWGCTSKLMNLICCRKPQYSTENEQAIGGNDSSQLKSSRLRSLDTFRGFSLTVMVFVNYGGGGYWFFQHAPWNGLTVADLVMPWFVFIIGTSVVLAFSSMRRRGVSRARLLRKMSWRTAVLFLIGFCFLNYSPRDGPLSLSWLRVPGVLQRLGFTYFILALMQTLCAHTEIPQKQHHWWNPVQDVVLYWPEWLLILLLEAAWLCLTLLLPVPHCPTGYMGAGGIGDYGRYPNCTGGAAAYIDRWLLGDNIYWHPTCKVMYRTTEPFDPEGVLGTINSVVMGFIGMQAGKILLCYRKMNCSILTRFLGWSIILDMISVWILWIFLEYLYYESSTTQHLTQCGLLFVKGISAAVLSKCTRDEGFIPVNKNLWSLSYVTCMGCFSFLLLGALYFIVDVKGWWHGQPFIYPGMNSIFVYVGHSLLGFYFPFSWELKDQDSHWGKLFQNLWATGLWVFIAYMLYRKKFFLKI